MPNRLLSIGPLLSLLIASTTAPAAEFSVSLEGVDGKAADNVRALVRVFELSERDSVDRATAQFYLDRTPAEVHEALTPFGYYQSRTDVDMSGDDSRLNAKVRVIPGEPVRVTSLDISIKQNGETVKPDFPLPEFPLKKGSRLNHSSYEKGKNEYSDAILNAGYIDFRNTVHDVEVRPAQLQSDIRLSFELGPLHHFGEIEFSGGQFDEEFLKRFVEISPGDVFSQDDLLELNQKLRDSGYFDRIAVMPDFDREDSIVPISVELTPAARTLYSTGVSYGTDTGVGLDFEADRRWVNRSGHRASLDLTLGQRKQIFGLKYDIPSGRRFDSYYQVGLIYSDEETDSSESQQSRLSVSRFRRWLDFRRTDSITYLSEDSIIADRMIASDFLLPSISLARAVGDEVAIPEKGYSVRGTLKAASDILISDTSLVQAELWGKKIWSIGDKTRLISRARLGLTWVDDFQQLPASLRFFAGGDRSIRGYDFEALGPVNADGEVIGGEHVLEGSFEYERVITGPYRGALFIDAGNAFSTEFDSSGNSVEVGAGFGLRYASPIGLIRVDIGLPVTAEDLSPRLHLVVGPDL